MHEYFGLQESSAYKLIITIRKAFASIHSVQIRDKRVCVQLHTLVDNVILLVFTAERRRAAVDRYLLAAGPTAANPPQRRVTAG